ncbi:matrixin family metalloprotease [Thermoactinomyces intermedius]|uniref:Matrixin family metalloprotease n=1 Tax=Thermoactinomyces intermedius TaxID=2024 RepID=A0A8I1A384_THEIN|nr:MULTISPECIES: matrixin family metalloprotease [Thermoactinomyces]MBA4548874.1 matrixin family metalloprotease [Thermoactinomyces intermedius]MBA4836873.1 matrixin family metalloprotease [Thermoactinomyces intermedius]MBH8594752.1 matrixin family metalloprotease [Thermoactinomyces intermedius]MBH8601989.1 matrixin family metalloprotease [Thermoactinomyces sp. CICC 23799]
MKKKALILFLITPLCVWIFPSMTFAYSFTGDKLCDYYYVYYRWGGHITKEHQEASKKAIQSWNEAQDKRRFVQGDSSATGVVDSYYSSTDGYFGYSYWQTGVGSCINSWVAKMNTYYESNNDSQFGQSVLGHEIGHVLGLAHTNWTSLMNTERDRFQTYTPQTDDINGVNNLYE